MDESIDNLSQTLQQLNTSSQADPTEQAAAESQSTASRAPEKVYDCIRKGDAFQNEYATTFSAEDLKAAIKSYEDGVESSNDPYLRAICFNNMGSALESLFDETDSIDWLIQAIEAKKQAVNSIPLNHQQRGHFYNGYSSLLQVSFERTGSIDDLNSAIAAVEEAIRTTTKISSDSPSFYNNLGIALKLRFTRTKEFVDLQRSVSMAKLAVEYSGNTDPNRPSYLIGLGNSLEMQFEWTGSLEDLNAAIQHKEDACQLIPDDSPLRPKCLHNLSIALERRFKQTGSMDDIEAAVQWSKEAARLSEGNVFVKARCLSGLGTAMKSRFERTGDGDDLVQAVRVLLQAVELTPDDHEEELASRLTNLGYVAHILFEHTQVVEHLAMAIDAAEDALDLTPEDHLDRASRLNNLGNALEDRYLLDSNIQDLELAIRYQQEAVDLTPADYPDRASYLGNLSNSLQTLYQNNHISDVWKRAVDVREESVSVSSAPPSMRVLYARLAAAQLVPHDIQRANLLFRTAIELLPKATPRNLDWSDSQHAVSQFPGLASDAAAVALECGFPPVDAVQLLDSGRMIILGQLLDIRNDLRGLPDELLARYESLQSQLDPPFQSKRVVPEAIRTNPDLHQAALNFESLQNEIRHIDGFQYFGLPLPEAELRKQAAHGPIIFLNVSGLRSDALIVHEDGITNLTLPKLEIDQVQEKVKAFQEAVNEITRSVKGNSPATPFKIQINEIAKVQKTKKRQTIVAEQQQIIFGILEWLWDVFVEPIFAKLGYIGQKPTILPRVWWCPTGAISYLPIHAAGYHKTPLEGRTVIDCVISSYTSSIRTLKYSRDRSNFSLSDRALIIAMPSTPGYRDLPLAEDEGYRVKYILGEKLQAEYLDNIDVEVMCHELQMRSIVHCICHAISETDPSKSRLLLKDGSLTVARMARIKIDPGAVAYLSACSTALSQAESLEDERIALSTAFQVAGFAGVVGCLWKADDDASFHMAKSFYDCLEGQTTRASQAFHRGVLDLRMKYPDEPSIWAPYIYTGA